MNDLNIIHSTFDQLQQFIQKNLESFGIAKEKIVLATTDGGSNIVKCFTEMKLEHHHCINHQLSLLSQKSIKPVKNIIERVKDLVSFFNKSTVGWQALKQAQTDTNKLNNFANIIYTLKTDSITRFNSCTIMVERFLLLVNDINCALDQLSESQKKFSDEDINNLEKVNEIFKPFVKMTDEFSGEDYCTMNIVLPKLIYNKDKIKKVNWENSHFLECKKILIEGLEEIIKDLLKKNFAPISTFFDPRYRSLKIFEKNEGERILAIIRNLVSQVEKNGKNDSINTKKSIIQNKIEINEEEQLMDIDRNCEIDEIDVYQEQKFALYSNEKFDVLQYWLQNEARFPNLSQIALKYAIMNASSISSERQFSQMGRLINKLRCCLKPETSSMLNFLKSNADMW